MDFVKIYDDNGKFLTWRIVKVPEPEPEINEAELDKHITSINLMQTVVIFCNVFQLTMSDLIDLLRYNGENYEVLR